MRFPLPGCIWNVLWIALWRFDRWLGWCFTIFSFQSVSYRLSPRWNGSSLESTSLLFCQAASLKGFKPQRLFQLKSSGVFQQWLGENCTTSGWQLTGAEAECNRRGRAGPQARSQQRTQRTAESGGSTSWRWWRAWQRSCWRFWPPSSWAETGPAARGRAAPEGPPPSARRRSFPRWCWGCRPASAAPRWTCWLCGAQRPNLTHSEEETQQEETQQICEHWKTDAENKTHNFLGPKI